eukprot:jgi/Undpi1/12872/HiC_scaffold_7.g02539.m1
MTEGLATRLSASNIGDSTDAPRDAFVMLSQSITDDIAVVFNDDAKIDVLHSEARRWLPSLSNMLANVQVGHSDKDKLSFELGRLNRKPLQAWLGRLETADPTKSNKTKMFTGPFKPPFLSTSGTPVTACVSFFSLMQRSSLSAVTMDQDALKKLGLINGDNSFVTGPLNLTITLKADDSALEGGSGARGDLRNGGDAGAGDCEFHPRGADKSDVTNSDQTFKKGKSKKGKRKARESVAGADVLGMCADAEEGNPDNKKKKDVVGAGDADTGSKRKKGTKESKGRRMNDCCAGRASMKARKGQEHKTTTRGLASGAAAYDNCGDASCAAADDADGGAGAEDAGGDGGCAASLDDVSVNRGGGDDDSADSCGLACYDDGGDAGSAAYDDGGGEGGGASSSGDYDGGHNGSDGGDVGGEDGDGEGFISSGDLRGKTPTVTMTSVDPVFELSSSSLEDNYLKPTFDRIGEDVDVAGSRIEASTRKPAGCIEEESPRDIKVMEAAVREGRGLNLNSEGACAKFFRARLGKAYRSLYLGEQVKERTGGMSTVYVTMPKTGQFFGKRKVSARDLKVARG